MLEINEELRDLIPPLTDEEYRGLEKSIIEDGCLNPIIVWGNVVVDGHNRFEICQQHGIPYSILEKQFADMNAVKVWMVEHQFGQRQLVRAMRVQLLLKIEDSIKERAKERMLAGKKADPVDNCPQGIESRTRDEIGKMAGVSGKTVDRIKQVNANAAPKVIEKMNSGGLSVSAALKTTLPPKEPEPPKPIGVSGFVKVYSTRRIKKKNSLIRLLEEFNSEIDRLTAIVEADDKLEALNKQILVLTKTNEALTSNVRHLNGERATMIRQIDFWRKRVEKQDLPPDEAEFEPDF